MGTLLMCFDAPLQSWGCDSHFEQRMTAIEPTKSGVIGLLAAALGLGRQEDEGISELAALEFGVRVDQPGVIIRDFHTAKGEKKRPSGNWEDVAYVSDRYYLSDAIFLVGVSSHDYELIQKLACAIKSPYYPLFLGRRSCPPTPRLFHSVMENPLVDALSSVEWLARNQPQNKPDSMRKELRLVIDDFTLMGKRRQDVPISFSWQHRRFGYRHLIEKPISVPVKYLSENIAPIDNDYFDEV